MADSIAVLAEVERVKAALSTLRPPLVTEEWELHRLIADALDAGGIAYQKEARLAPRCRVDFLCPGGVALEVKRGKPSRAALLQQLHRYAVCDRVSAILLVVERSANLPGRIGDKPCEVFGLNRLWGVAL